MLKEEILINFWENCHYGCLLWALEQVYSPFYCKHVDYFFLSNVHMIQKIIANNHNL
jgi:hypothetical protein